jgi:hypothetical protein
VVFNVAVVAEVVAFVVATIEEAVVVAFEAEAVVSVVEVVVVDLEVVEDEATDIIKVNCFSCLCYLPFFAWQLLPLLFFLFVTYIRNTTLNKNVKNKYFVFFLNPTV